MSADEELLDLLRDALAPPDRQPPTGQIAALRAAAAAAATPAGLGQVGPAPSAVVLPLAGRWPRIVLGGLAGVAATVAAFFLGGALLGDDGSSPPATSLEFSATLRSPDGAASARVTGVLTGIGREVTLSSDDLPILPKGEFYEVWFVGPTDAAGHPDRISAGTFHPDPQGQSQVALTAAVDPARYPELAVTAEPGDGDPAPTGPEVLRAELERP